MTIELILLLLSIILFLALRSLNIHSTNLTGYELRRQAKFDETAKQNLDREKLLPDLLTLRFGLEIVFVIAIVLCSVVLFDWWRGATLAFVIIITIATTARWSFLRRNVQKIYNKYQENILRLVKKIQPILKLIRIATPKSTDEFTLHSKAELIYLVNQAEAVFDKNERLLLSSALKFSDQTVGEIMTQRSDIHSIDQLELLGPLVLDDLHKLGHHCFPVMAKNIDHIVGTLELESLLTINTKHSVTAQKAMQPKVFYLHKDQTLPQTLAAFLRTRTSLFIVVDELQKTVGIVSLNDVIKALLGRKIVDEFDNHEDIRAVAKRDYNNHSESKIHDK